MRKAECQRCHNLFRIKKMAYHVKWCPTCKIIVAREKHTPGPRRVAKVCACGTEFHVDSRAAHLTERCASCRIEYNLKYQRDRARALRLAGHKSYKRRAPEKYSVDEETPCVCPTCGAEHTLIMFYTGRLPARKYCQLHQANAHRSEEIQFQAEGKYLG